MRSSIIALLAAAGLLAGAGMALAQSGQPKISFPIAELGGCNSKDECKAYCDDRAHAESCLSFAESRGMMSKEEAKTARKFMGQTGPGGCTGSACRQYCNSEEHFAECRAFAEKNGLIPPRGERPEGPAINKDKEDAVAKLVEEQGGPGGCTSKDTCRAYCDDSSHMDECMAFAKKSGLMSEEQIEQAKKMMQQEGPGGCKGAACRDYCEDSSHIKECLEFGQKQGLMSQDEAQRAQEFHDVLLEGGPGGCTDEQSCRSFCGDPANRETCENFSRENGFGGEPRERQEREQGQDSRIERPDMRPEGMPSDRQKENCGTPEECRAKFEASGKELPPGQDVREMQQRQRPTIEQEKQMRQEFDRRGAEEQNRGREMMQFNNGQGNPTDRTQGGPAAAIIGGLESLLRFLGF